MTRNRIQILTFENTVFLSDRDMLRLLREIDNVTLLRACKKCDDFIVRRIMGPLSNQARGYFEDDFVKMGNVSDDEILAAQNRIGEIFSELYLKGKLKDWATVYAV